MSITVAEKTGTVNKQPRTIVYQGFKSISFRQAAVFSLRRWRKRGHEEKEEMGKWRKREKGRKIRKAEGKGERVAKGKIKQKR